MKQFSDMPKDAPRRLEFLQMLSQGLRYAQIAKQCCCTDDNVKNTIWKAMQLYKCKTTTELVAECMRAGVIK